MKSFDQSIELLSEIEMKSPPVELFDKVMEQALSFDRRFLIRLVLIISLGFGMTFMVVKVGKSNQKNQTVETYFSTSYNLYGYE
jgi:hypothetical protein